MHLLRADLSPVADFVSDYANGPYRRLFATSAIVHGVGNLAIAAGLWLVFEGSPSGRWGVGLFGLAALGMVVAGAFPTDAPGASTTVAGATHRGAATVSFVAELVALVLLAPAVRDRLGWRAHAWLTRVLAVLAAYALAWLAAAIAAGWPPGLPERAALVVFLVWELATGLRLLVAPAAARRRARPAARQRVEAPTRRGRRQGPFGPSGRDLVP